MAEEVEEELVYSIQFAGETDKLPHVSKDGVATATFANKDSYTGEYRGGQRNGRGVYQFANGAKYDGEYADNKRHGSGELHAPDGSSYVGQWSGGRKHGVGTYVYGNGDKYVGEWSNDVRQGRGVYFVNASKTQISGTWVNGECRAATIKYPDGTSYTGVLSKNKLEGNGAFVFSNGNSEAGSFHQSKWGAPVYVAPQPQVSAVPVDGAELEEDKPDDS